MSLSNLLQPNSTVLYCESLSADVITSNTIDVTDLDITGSLTVHVIHITDTTTSSFLSNGGGKFNNDLTIIGGCGLSGSIQVNTNATVDGNLYLATTGYTKAPLNYYEVFTTTLLFNLFASTAINAKFTKLGNIIIFELEDWAHQFATEENAPLTYGSFANQIPLRFRPTQNITYYSRMRWQNPAEDPYTYLDGYVTITSSGEITWYTYNKSTTDYTLNVGASRCSFSWTN
jgi:hypothetical protein